MKKLISAKEFAEDYKAEGQEELFHIFVAFVLAVAQMLTLYLTLSLAYNASPFESCLGMVSDSGLPWMVAALLSRGFLQPLNFIVFAFAANTLAIRLWVMRREFHAFAHPYFDNIPISPQGALSIGEGERAIPLQNVQAIGKEYSGALPLLVRRIEIGSRRLAEGGDASEIHNVMHALSDIDHDNLEKRLTLVRYLTWLVPTIGFLGTVLGMGLAIMLFSDVLTQFGGGAEEFQTRLQGVLGQVTVNLGTAFDTTTLALFLSVLLVALTSVVQNREEGLLSSIDEFCLHHFVSRVSVPNGNDRMLKQIMMVLMPLAQSMDAHGKRVSGSHADEGITLRDIAGLIAAQPERLKQSVIEANAQDDRSALATNMRRLADAMSKLAERIEKAWPQNPSDAGIGQSGAGDSRKPGGRN